MPEAPAISQAPASTPAIPVFTEQTVETVTPAETPEASETPAAQAPAAQAEGETPTGQAPEKPEQPEKPGKSRFERRLDKAYRRAAEAEARAKVYEQELQKFSQPKDDTEPKLEQYDDIEKYAQAKAKHQTEKAFKEHQAKQTQESARQFQQRVTSEWEQKAAAV